MLYYSLALDSLPLILDGLLDVLSLQYISMSKYTFREEIFRTVEEMSLRTTSEIRVWQV